MQARFWIFVNDAPVRIKLNPGQSLGYDKRWSTDEGWSSEFCRWEFNGDAVMREYGTDGRDCDGRLASYGEDHCPLDMLGHRSAPDIGRDVAFPDWQDQESSVHDEQAQLANY